MMHTHRHIQTPLLAGTPALVDLLSSVAEDKLTGTTMRMYSARTMLLKDDEAEDLTKCWMTESLRSIELENISTFSGKKSKAGIIRHLAEYTLTESLRGGV